MTALLLGDLTGRSRVALRMLCAALEERGHEVLMLPTALVSNTLSLGRCATLDTTDYLLDALRVWQELGIRCDIAYIGYITGTRQAQALCGVADALRAAGVRVIRVPGEAELHGAKGDTVSFLPLGDAQGGTLAGFFYPLTEHGLHSDYPLGVSNVVTQDEARVSVKSGDLLMFHNLP